jgi:hypothetical protein
MPRRTKRQPTASREDVQEQTLLAILASSSSRGYHEWHGNDRTGRRTYNQRVPFVKEMTVRLFWQSGRANDERELGLFRLNLEALRAAQFIRRDRPGFVRVAFFHTGGVIKLARKRKSRGLIVGEFKEEPKTGLK